MDWRSVLQEIRTTWLPSGILAAALFAFSLLIDPSLRQQSFILFNFVPIHPMINWVDYELTDDKFQKSTLSQKGA
jgi:hypothetical protein